MHGTGWDPVQIVRCCLRNKKSTKCGLKLGFTPQVWRLLKEPCPCSVGRRSVPLKSDVSVGFLALNTPISNWFQRKNCRWFPQGSGFTQPVWTLQSSFLYVCLALNPQTSQLKQVVNITWGTTLAAWQVSGSSLATLAFLQRMPALCRGRNLLELGAGRGLLGIGAAALGGAGEVGVLGWGWGKWWEHWAEDGWENAGKMMVYDGKMIYSFPSFKAHHKPS